MRTARMMMSDLNIIDVSPYKLTDTINFLENKTELVYSIRLINLTRVSTKCNDANKECD